VKIERASTCLLILLVAGMALRSVGFSRGVSDFVLPEDRAAGHETAFYAFHPDEISLLNAALRDIDLLNPPYTSYGTLPPYALGGLLRLFDLHEGRQTLKETPPEFRRRVYFTARALSILFSVGVLVFTALVAWRLYGEWAAVAATGIVAFAPGAIQQAHFYITDGPFALASLATLWAILGAVDGPREWRRFLVAGALIGTTACIRFNGGLLGLALVGTLLLRSRGSVRQRMAEVLRERRLWVAGGVAIGLLLLMHPYVLTRPELLSRTKYVGDFALTIKYASLEYLQPWTLVDVDVIPFVSHWFGMWPLVVGWPLTIGFLASLVWAVWRGGWQERLLAAWVLLYFLPVGLLPARAVRHLVPILAVLAILSAGAVLDLLRTLPDQRLRRGLSALGIVLAAHLFLYGTGFARIYLVEDSRIRAGRFLAERVRPGNRIGVESGAYSVAGLVSSQRHLWMDISTLLYTGPYMLCADRVDFLSDKLKRVGAMVYVEENRAVQYAAVPELFPVAASFFAGLSSGRFGLDVVRRFKTHPEVAGIRFEDAGMDPTFSGYDHPAVDVLLRRDDADFETTLGRWRRELLANPWCPDDALLAAAVRLRAGDAPGALAVVREAITANPNALISYRLEAEILSRMGDTEGARQAMLRYGPETAGGRMAHVINPKMVHFVCAATALSLARLGLYDSALAELERGIEEDSSFPRALQLRAKSYLRVAAAFETAGQADHREATIRMSLEVFRTAEAFNALAKIEARIGDLDTSRQLLEQSVLVNGRQPNVHLALAELYLATDPDYDRVLYHLDRAQELDETLQDRVRELRERLDAIRGPAP
jgi:tetratricopeptide (TPR) repeat protein